MGSKIESTLFGINMKMFSIDLEWNCPKNNHYFYKDQLAIKNKEEPLIFTDIIDFGVCYIPSLEDIKGKKDVQLKDYFVNNSFQSLVKPLIWSKLNPRIAKLTGYTSAQLKQEGIIFKELWQLFIDWQDSISIKADTKNNILTENNSGDEILLFSWTLSDAFVLSSAFKGYNIDQQENVQIYFVDVQKLFVSLLQKEAGSYSGLKSAFAYIRKNETDETINFHNALTDAKILVMIMKFILDKLGARDFQDWIEKNRISLSRISDKLNDILLKKRSKIQRKKKEKKLPLQRKSLVGSILSNLSG